MKKIILPLLLTVLFVCGISVSSEISVIAAEVESDVAITEENFPDENFRAYVKEQIDQNSDDVLSEGEIKSVLEIWVDGREISDLTGLERFTFLKRLQCSDNALEELDVSGNPALKYLDCGFNQLTELDVSGNPALMELRCNNNALTELDVNGNPALEMLRCNNNALTELEVSENPALMELWCSNNALTELDVSQNLKLKDFECAWNKLVSLDVSTLSELRYLCCSDNALTALDVSQNSKLEEVACTGNIYTFQYKPSQNKGILDLTTLPGNFDINKVLEWKGSSITVDDTTVTFTMSYVFHYVYDIGNGKTMMVSIDPERVEDKEEVDKEEVDKEDIEYPIEVFNDVPITKENFPDGKFRTHVKKYDEDKDNVLSAANLWNVKSMGGMGLVDVQSLEGIGYFKNLKKLEILSSAIKELDLSQNTLLKELIVSSDELKELDLSQNKDLTSLELYINVTGLDLSQNKDLTSLEIHSDNLTELDLSQNTNLTSLDIGHKNLLGGKNNLTELDLSQLPVLTSLTLRKNNLTELDLSKNSKLTILRAEEDNMSELNLSQNAELTQLYVRSRKMEELDVTQNPKLQVLDVEHNNLKKLDLKHNVELDILYCRYNDLKELDVSANQKLTKLKCSGNELLELDISQNTKLTYLECGDNKLLELNLDGTTELEELYCSNNMLLVLNVKPCEKLKLLVCSRNRLTSLELGEHAGLQQIDCYNNKLRTLDVTGCSSLGRLQCQDNALTTLDVTNSSLLNYLICVNNNLTELDFSKNTKLYEIYASENPLTSIDLSQNIKLDYWECIPAKAYNIAMTGDTFDLSSLPGDFDVSKASDWKNATVKGNILTIVDHSKDISYQYNISMPGYSKAVNEFLLHPVFESDESVLITEEVFPDENFKFYVEEYIDQDSDGVLTKNEIAQVEKISVNCMGITDMTGVEVFSSLKQLSCGYNEISSLDVSQNTELEVLDCNGNNLENLQTSENTKVEDSEADINLYDVKFSYGRCEMVNLPGNIDVRKASNWENAIVDGVTLKILDKEENISFTYQMENGEQKTFVIWPVFEEQSISRLQGASRYETSEAIADCLKEYRNVQKFRAVIIATGKNFADALAGSCLATKYNAPILLTNGKPENVAKLHDYIYKNVIKEGTIYILGGESAVPKSIENITGYNVVRLAGKSRYETNIKILQEVGTSGDEIIVATGKTFADSLSASATGLPILLVKPDSTLDDVQKSILEKYDQIYIVGGTGAVSESYEEELKAYGIVERVYGENRYETSIAIANKFFDNVISTVVASGKNFPDGLCGGALAAEMDAPLILTRDGNISDAASYVRSNKITDAYIFGGDAALSQNTVQQIFKQ